MNRGPIVTTSLQGKQHRRLLVTLSAVAIVMVALVASLGSLALAADDFPDVAPGHAYYTAISDLASRGIIGGYTDGRFGPGDPVRRQQFAKMIVGTGGYPVSEANVCPFNDVVVSGPDSLYPDNYVAVCAANGITLGRTETTFDPYAYITRYQVISMVVRTADNLQPGLLASPPSGWSGAWGGDPTHGANADRAQYNGLLDGLDLTTLSAFGNMTRGEVAQVLHNLLEKLGTTPAVTYSLSLSASPAAGGTLAASPDQTSYAAGASVTLTATAATGYIFSSWSGDAGGTTNPLTVTMNADKTIVANFQPGPPVALGLTTAVSPSGSGAVQRDPDQATYALDATVTLTAVPATGYVFHHWSGSATGTTNPLTVTMNTVKAITANFAPGPDPYPGYEDLGVTNTTGVAVCSGFPEYLWLFVRGSDGSVRHRFYGGSWAAWENLGGNMKAGSNPAACCSKGFTHTDVFIRGLNNHLWYSYNTTGDTWTAWKDMGVTLYSDPAVCSPDWGEMAVFWRASDGTLRMKRYKSGTWESSSHALGGSIKAGTSPAVVSYPSGLQNGDIHVFIMGTNNHLWHRQYRGTTHAWTSWYDTGRTIDSSPTATSWAVARIDVFFRYKDCLHQITGNGNDAHWGAPVKLSGTEIGADMDGVSPEKDSRIDLFVRSDDNHLLHTWYYKGTWNP